MALRLRWFSLCVLLWGAVVSAQNVPAPNVVLQGDVRPAQNQTYFEVPFTVPAGTHRITVTFHNLGKDQHTVLDLGIADPFRFRGASGGNKDHFTLSETDATPSYLPGAIPPGRWKLLIAVPNIRAGVTSRFRAEVWFNSAFDDASFTEQPLNEKPGWYRGDLHMHTAHSDGSCASQSGKPVPCPLFLTVEDAVRRGLDFIAITDHNATSQYDDERELQPYFDKLLLIPGRELTTFHGHANELGTTRFIDYRVGSKQVPDVNAMFREARSLGAIVSINHPQAPTGEICMGCGWNPSPAADMKLVTSIEVVNGGGLAGDALLGGAAAPGVSTDGGRRQRQSSSGMGSGASGIGGISDDGDLCAGSFGGGDSGRDPVGSGVHRSDGVAGSDAGDAGGFRRGVGDDGRSAGGAERPGGFD